MKLRTTSTKRGMLRRSLATGIAALALTMSAATAAHGQDSLFYSNINTGSPGYPTYYDPKGAEYADDVPFTGTHEVSSFSFGYDSAEPVHATFRFYGVNQATELLGTQVAQIERDLPAGQNAPTIALSEAERFTWTAEPYLYPGEFNGTYYYGGWYSVQFTTATGEPASSVRFRLGTGTSHSGLLNVDKNIVITTLDPSGILPSSMYLQVQDSASSNIVQPNLTKMSVYPSTVKAGGTANATAFLAFQAPFGGTTVTLKSSNPSVAGVPTTVTVPAGATNISIPVYTSRRTKSTQVVALTATANGSSVSTTLTVTP